MPHLPASPVRFEPVEKPVSSPSRNSRHADFPTSGLDYARPSARNEREAAPEGRSPHGGRVQ